jgi:hypothetical protein
LLLERLQMLELELWLALEQRELRLSFILASFPNYP